VEALKTAAVFNVEPVMVKLALSVELVPETRE